AKRRVRQIAAARPQGQDKQCRSEEPGGHGQRLNLLPHCYATPNADHPRRTAPKERLMTEALLQTTVVGSYPQPDWLVNRSMLSKVVPRTRLKELWRVPEEFLEQAQDDATLLAIRDMERAGIDIVTDGEIRRESYSNRFATALEG